MKKILVLIFTAFALLFHWDVQARMVHKNHSTQFSKTIHAQDSTVYITTNNLPTIGIWIEDETSAADVHSQCVNELTKAKARIAENGFQIFDLSDCSDSSSEAQPQKTTTYYSLASVVFFK